MSTKRCSSCGKESTPARNGEVQLHQVVKLAKVAESETGSREDLYDTLFSIYWCNSCGHIDLYVLPAIQQKETEDEAIQKTANR